MEKLGLLKNKNLIVNLGIILLALFLAFKIYDAGNQQVNSLIQQKEDEAKKNAIIENIVGLESRMDSYKKVLIKKDLSSVMAEISNLAKNNSIEIASVKPLNDENYTDYVKSSFLLTIKAPSYHALGDFISQIESFKDLYLVAELSINSDQPKQEEDVSKGLSVSLKISTISYI